jgi:1-acyl-sn-glycerol-3-phosphate acyltransferase
MAAHAQPNQTSRPRSVAQALPPADSGVGARRTANGEDGCATGTPHVSPWLLNWFGRYTAHYLRSHFSHVWLAGEVPRLEGRPVIVFANHASWWDPLVCLHLHRKCFADRPAFAPIDAKALARYGILGRLGFFPVEQDSRRGAVQFLRASQAILADPDAMLWLTPQGEFQDQRARPLRFKPGLSHLVGRLDAALLVPLAIDYFHGVERLPEVAVRFGEPIEVASEGTRRIESGRPPRHLGGYSSFENALEQTQDQLAEDVMHRSTRPLSSLLSGRSGIGGIYDLWRRANATLRGRHFEAGHGDLLK